jgi:transmembrane sensor
MSAGAPREAGDPRRRREAAAWLVEHESGQELSPARLPAWEAWMDDADNRAEYAAMVHLRRDLHALGPQSLPSSEALLEDSFDVDHPPVSPAPVRATVTAGRGRRGRGRRSFAVAAGAAFLLCLAGLPLARWLRSPAGAVSGPAQTYATGAGEQRAFTLDDGSEMTLGGNTSAVVSFTATGRTVVLGRGEGLFHVQHDRLRPFQVCAVQACVTAIGTIFDVHLYSDRVRVWVQQGSVEVAPIKPVSVDEAVSSAAQWSPLRLQRGQEMSYAADGEASAPGPADARAAEAWTQGSLIYHGRPLSEVIEDVQRYSARPILLDPAAANLRYSGSVIQQHIDQWIRGLSDIFPVEIVDCRALSRSSSGDRPLPPACRDAPDRVLIRSRMTP